MHVSVGASRPKTAVIGSCLSHIELQMILLAPHDKGVNHSSVPGFIIPRDASNRHRDIRKLLKMAVSV